MKSFLENNRILLTIAIFLLAVFASAYFLLIPTVSGVWQLSNKIQENLADQKAENRRLAQIPQMEEDWKIVESQKDMLNVILKPENEIEFIENIEAIALKSGCIIALNIGEQSDPQEIKKIKTLASKKGGKKGIMDEISIDTFFPVQINLKGDYIGLVNFIKMLENSQIYVNIISMRIEKEELEKDKTSDKSPFSKEPEKTEKKEILSLTVNAIVYTQ